MEITITNFNYNQDWTELSDGDKFIFCSLNGIYLNKHNEQTVIQFYDSFKKLFQEKFKQKLHSLNEKQCDFIVDSLNAYWNDANYSLTERNDLGDLEKKNLESVRIKSKEIMEILMN